MAFHAQAYMRFFSIGNNSVSGDPNDLSGLAELPIFTSDDSTWNAEALSVNNAAIARTFDISNNNLTGIYPEWLLKALSVNSVSLKVCLHARTSDCCALDRGCRCGRAGAPSSDERGRVITCNCSTARGTDQLLVCTNRC